MSELEGFSYAVFGVYSLTSFGLMAAGRRLGVAGEIKSRALLTLAAFLIAGLWPLIGLGIGEPTSPDPVQLHLDGLTGDLAGHALLASGGLTAMMAEVQILTRARVAALAPAEAAAGPLVYRFVAIGRILLLAGLFLVFPSVVLGGLAIAAALVVMRLEPAQGSPRVVV